MVIEECCRPEASQVRKEDRCPQCGEGGKPVGKFTVSVFAKDPALYLHPEELGNHQFFLCETKSCQIVYFSAERALGKDGVRGKVWQKEDDPDLPVCYCFHHTLSSILRELKDGGSTDVLARIAAEVRAGNCRCEVMNPQGSCCLGNVAKAVKAAKELLHGDDLLHAGGPARLVR